MRSWKCGLGGYESVVGRERWGGGGCCLEGVRGAYRCPHALSTHNQVSLAGGQVCIQKEEPDEDSYTCWRQDIPTCCTQLNTWTTSTPPRTYAITSSMI